MYSKEQIIFFLQKNKKATFLELAKNLRIPTKNNRDFSNFLFHLKNEGIIAYSKKNDIYYIPKLIGTFETQYKTNIKGFGFCFVEYNNADIRALIYNNSLNALKNDDILVNVYEEWEEGYFFAIILKIIKRKYEVIYAEIDENLNIKPINFDHAIELEINKEMLIPNTFVKLYPKEFRKNKIILDVEKQLLPTNKPYSDIELMIDSYCINQKFSDKTIEQLKNIPDEIQDEFDFNRLDLSKKLVVTIDGEKTKDFDDAISLEKNENGNYVLGVHIADVAYYVKEDTPLDKDACERGTSIYLLDKVIPMLPEKLSNGICSLNPNVKRFTLSLISEIDSNGTIIKNQILPTMIESKYRLTYNQVANLDNEEIFKNNKDLYNMLKEAYKLSDILSKKKSEDGYIDFEIEEPIIELDKNTGKAIEIKIKQRLSSEVLIENFMVFANEQVSKIISDLKIPSIYRVHKAPEAEKIESLKMFLKSLNITGIDLQINSNPKNFQTAIKKIKTKRFDNLIKMSILRTMQKAKYSSDNIGHFGLASKHYSHFTSPIRRYPDLLLHRIIWEVLFKSNKNYSFNIKNKIDEIASHSSTSEIRAIELERSVKDMKKAEFYESKINSIKEAIIVSIHKFGLFVEFDDQTNSLVHISTLSENNEYEISSDMCKLIIKNKEKVYFVGQKVNVKILSISKMEGKIDSIII